MTTLSFYLLAAAADPGGGFQWRAFLAPFHSVLLHFPIGFVTLACLLDLYYLRNPHEEVRKLSRILMYLCAASAVVVASLGLLRALGGGYEEHSLASHRFWGLTVTAVIITTLIAQKLTIRHEKSRRLRRFYRVSLFSSLGVLVVTGHLGGSLTYGSGYLVKNAPEFVKTMFDKEGDEVANSSVVAAEPAVASEEQHFLEAIQPIFQQKCYGCHGPEKQKGNYRLDQKAIALKGGDSEETAIEPGDAMSSFLAHLILLPPDDDDVMPPEGKEPLTPEEIVSIIRWIQSGAPFPDNASLASTNN